MSRGNTQERTSDRFAVIWEWSGSQGRACGPLGRGQTAAVSGVCRRNRRGNGEGRISLEQEETVIMEANVRQSPENTNGQRVKVRPVSASDFNDWTVEIGVGRWVTCTESVSTAPPLFAGETYPALHCAGFLWFCLGAQLPSWFWSLCCVFWEVQCGVYCLTLASGLIITQPQHELATAAKHYIVSLGAVWPRLCEPHSPRAIGSFPLAIENLKAPDTILWRVARNIQNQNHSTI